MIMEIMLLLNCKNLFHYLRAIGVQIFIMGLITTLIY